MQWYESAIRIWIRIKTSRIRKSGLYVCKHSLGRGNFLGEGAVTETEKYCIWIFFPVLVEIFPPKPGPINKQKILSLM